MSWIEKAQSNLTYGWHQLHSSVSQMTDSTILFLKSDQAQKFVYDNLSYTWKGFSQKLNSLKLTQAIVGSNSLQKIYKQSSLENIIFYAGPVLIFEGLKKPLLLYVPYGDSPILETTLDALAKFFFLRVAVRMFVNNTAYNISANTAMINLLEPAPLMKGCDCAVIEKAKAGVMSPLYFTGNLISSAFIGFIPGVGKYPAMFLKTLAYGQCIVDYRFSELGMCMLHREELWNNNNAYCFGVGASLFTMTELFCFFIHHVTGVKSGFINDAIFSYLFQYYILISLLQKEPLPGQAGGMNIFHYSQVIVQAIVADILNLVVPRLGNENNRGYYQQKLQAIAEFPVVKYIKYLVLDKSFQSLENFVKLPAIGLLIDLHQKAIVKGLDTVMQARGYPLWLADYAPDFIATQNTRTILKILNDKGWHATNAFIKNLIRLSVRSREVSQQISAEREENIEVIEKHVDKESQDVSQKNSQGYINPKDYPQVKLEQDLAEAMQYNFFYSPPKQLRFFAEPSMPKQVYKPPSKKSQLLSLFAPLVKKTKSLKKTLDPTKVFSWK